MRYYFRYNKGFKMSQYERMISGRLYSWKIKDEKREALSNKRNEFLDEFNQTSYGDFKKREELIRAIFKQVGKNACINKPFHCDYGCHISVGDYFFANFNCMMLDVAPITIGNHVFLAPNVSIFTAGHPISAKIRQDDLEYGLPVVIGNDVWIGGNCVINPGVTIGSNVVIGSGSVVTKDIPSGVIAAGNPCRVIRVIDEQEEKKWALKAEEFYNDLKKEGISL